MIRRFKLTIHKYSLAKVYLYNGKQNEKLEEDFSLKNNTKSIVCCRMGELQVVVFLFEFNLNTTLLRLMN